jgi:hypothetical protein
MILPVLPSPARLLDPGLAEQMLSRELSGNVNDFQSCCPATFILPWQHPPLSLIFLSPRLILPNDFESQQLEQRLEPLFDEKIEIIRREGSSSLADSWTDARVNEVFSLFKTQLEKDAREEKGKRPMDARGEIDFEVIRDVIQEGQHERKGSHTARTCRCPSSVWRAAGRQQGLSSDLLPVLEQHNEQTIQAVVSAVSQASTRMETSQNDRSFSEFEREALLRDFIVYPGPQ